MADLEIERIPRPYSPLSAFCKQKWEERMRKVEGVIEEGGGSLVVEWE